MERAAIRASDPGKKGMGGSEKLGSHTTGIYLLEIYLVLMIK